MRLISIVLGFLLAILVAYVHDSVVAPQSADGQPQSIVNWEVFSRTMGNAGVWVHKQTDHLLDQIHHRD